MSWDVILIKTKTNTERMDEINEENIVAFDLDFIITTLKTKFTTIDHIDDQWLHYESSTFEISFNLAAQIMLHVHILDEPENAAELVIHELCRLFECRAFDTTRGEFLKISQVI